MFKENVKCFNGALLVMKEKRLTLEHIIEEEKEHVAELLKLISVLDPVQAEKLSKQVW